MKQLELGVAFAALIAVMVGAAPPARAQAKAHIAYFLDETSDAADMRSNLPANASDIIVAKVRFLDERFWLLGRHGEGPGNDVLADRVQIAEVKRGRAENGQVFDVRMGVRTDYRDFVSPFAVPITPNQLRREYTVIIYSAEDGIRRLASFIISPTQYARWEAEVSTHGWSAGQPSTNK
jgi:hypothetical protein